MSPRSRVILPPLNLTEEAVLLALDGQRSRLRVVVNAAAHADGEPHMTLRGARRSLRAAGLVERVGPRSYRPTAASARVERRRLVGGILFYPKGAAPREIDLAVLLLLSGTMPTRARRLTRGLMVALPADAITPMITWLMRQYGVSTPKELADEIMWETPEPMHFEEGAFDPGMAAGLDGA
ncbi:MAG: hypothetical protein JWQ76_5760 [Ramlibacter sp.]|nr:hypothetical protein [Ramlibacter sp.]